MPFACSRDQNYPNAEKTPLSGVSWKEIALGSFSCNSTQFSVSLLGFLTREQYKLGTFKDIYWKQIWLNK